MFFLPGLGIFRLTVTDPPGYAPSIYQKRTSYPRTLRSVTVERREAEDDEELRCPVTRARADVAGH